MLNWIRTTQIWRNQFFLEFVWTRKSNKNVVISKDRFDLQIRWLWCQLMWPCFEEGPKSRYWSDESVVGRIYSSDILLRWWRGKRWRCGSGCGSDWSWWKPWVLMVNTAVMDGWRKGLEAGFDPGSKLDQRTKEFKGRRRQRSKLDSVLQWRLLSSSRRFSLNFKNVYWQSDCARSGLLGYLCDSLGRKGPKLLKRKETKRLENYLRSRPCYT